MRISLTDEQVYQRLIAELGKSYNVQYTSFRFQIGVRHIPYDDYYWAIGMCRDDVTWIEFSEIPESVFNQLCSATSFVVTDNVGEWSISYSQTYSRVEIEKKLTDQTRQGIITNALLDIAENII